MAIRKQILVTAGLIILTDFGFCDNTVREKDWRRRTRGTQATWARQSDLAGATCGWQRQSFSRLHTLGFGKYR
jgi:hypothetical protein